MKKFKRNVKQLKKQVEKDFINGLFELGESKNFYLIKLFSGK